MDMIHLSITVDRHLRRCVVTKSRPGQQGIDEA